MIPRILVLVDREQYFMFKKLERIGACTFVPYDGLLTPEAIAGYIQQHRQNFDSVAVLGGRENADVRQTLDAHFDGPKILFDFDEPPTTNPDYVVIRGPVRVQDFERTIREAFAALR